MNASTIRSLSRAWPLLAALSLGGCTHDDGAHAAGRGADAQSPIAITTAVVSATEQAVTLDLTGTLLPEQQSEVTPAVAGRVDKVLVERGSVVKAGQPLLRLRDLDFRSAAASASVQLSQAAARLGIAGAESKDKKVAAASAASFQAEETPEAHAARANLEIAEDALKRAEPLRESATISEQEYARLKSQAAASRAQYANTINNTRSAYLALSSARVQLEQNRRALADSVVRAPFDGEIAERHANVGEYVSPQKPVVTLVRTDLLRLEVQVPQDRVAAIRSGQPVEVRVDAFPEQRFAGTVRYISPVVRAESRALTVEAVVPNSERLLRPGTFARAKLDLGKRQTLTSVPAAAVLGESGAYRVFVVSEAMARERLVTIVERKADTVLLSEGLRPGERVATSQLERLSDGARVQAL